MHILFTGLSSFTGSWIVKSLADAGHSVVAALNRPIDCYDAMRLKRIQSLRSSVKIVPQCPFGSDTFGELIKSSIPFDAFCHHGAQVIGYKADDFDPIAAIANNCHNLRKTLLALSEKQCRNIILTGTVFEAGEGTRGDNAPAISPYGLSKTLTRDIFQFYSKIFGVNLARFVIANPFGPFEEPRLTTYLVREWSAGRTAKVLAPDYIRDNIPITALSHHYVQFLEDVVNQSDPVRVLRPSHFVESNQSFSLRFANEIGNRLNLRCSLEFLPQTDFS